MAVAQRHSMRRFAAALTSLALAVPATAETSLCCPADITSNGIVNSADLGVLLASWGSEGKATDTRPTPRAMPRDQRC